MSTRWSGWSRSISPSPRGEGLEQAVEANLNMLVRDVVAKARDDGASIELALPSSLKATVRPIGFKRALTNIVRNAERFASEIRVGASRRAGMIVIFVDDDGPGIPESERDDAFKAFHRLDHARNRDRRRRRPGADDCAGHSLRGHGGDVILAESPMGGLRAVLRFPV